MRASVATDLIGVVVHAQILASDRALLLELRRPDATPLPAAEPGAHIDVHLSTAAGKMVRPYSLLDVTDPGRYLICVQLETDGRGGSRHVHERLRVGQRLTVSAPRSTFTLGDGRRHAVLLAGGIGITPLLAMAGALEARGASYELHCYSRGPLPLAEYVAAQPYAGRVEHHRSDLGQSLRDSAPEWSVTDDIVVYACGPRGFLDKVGEHAAAVGVPADRVRTERFVTEEPVDATGDSFVVVAASSGERMTVADETIAEVLERHGYEVVLSCEQGICGSCLTGVIDGIPDHRDEVQTPAEHAANGQINVCVSRSRSAVLTLDV
ncbi:MAG: PDR/VanB family oxidoreductase [Nocardioides sp.]|uniref:PDR/VanB family oxidoreductase n=1 Tax=Nocardioides sp. TaxID=35761 RepID=UPI0039E48898